MNLCPVGKPNVGYCPYYPLLLTVVGANAPNEHVKMPNTKMIINFFILLVCFVGAQTPVFKFIICINCPVLPGTQDGVF